MDRKSPVVSLWATSNSCRSESSTSWCASPRRSATRTSIVCATPSSRRSVASSLTSFA